MGLPVNIDDILHGHSVEWERLEFKSGWNPESIMHTICAFANDFHNLGGGYLFIGIAEDDGRPILPPLGLEVSQIDAIQKHLVELGFKIQPSYHPIVEPCLIEGRSVIILRVPGGQNRPYKAPDALSNNRSSSYYIRKGSCTIRAQHNDEIELLSLAAQIPYDDRMNQGASVDHLSLPLIQGHLREIGSDLHHSSNVMDFGLLCRRMGIIDGPSERPLPRNIGLMFFNDTPEKFFTQAQIDVVHFPDGASGDTIIEKTFKGPIDQQVKNSLSYLSNSVLKEFVLKREGRAEAERFFNYPYAALEEILVNAVYHRSYEIREPIEVRVLPDHITITSYPGPDRSISLADLAGGRLIARRYRNRRIGEFLKELRLTEGRGTGIPRAIRAMAENGSPEPRFSTDEDRSYFTAVLPAHNLSVGNSPLTPPLTPQVAPQVSEEIALLISKKKVNTLLAYCISPKDRTNLQKHLGLRDVQHFRLNYLWPLMEGGLLAMTNPAHPTSPTQKYKTTALGVALLEQFQEKNS